MKKFYALFVSVCLLMQLFVGLPAVSAAEEEPVTVDNSLDAEETTTFLDTDRPSVTLTAEAGAKIYYTLDGSIPSAEHVGATGDKVSYLYETPIDVYETGKASRTVLRYLAVKDGRSSETYTRKYIVNTAGREIGTNIAAGKTNYAAFYNKDGLTRKTEGVDNTWYQLRDPNDDTNSMTHMPLADMPAEGNNKLTDSNLQNRYGLWHTEGFATEAEQTYRMYYLLDLGPDPDYYTKVELFSFYRRLANYGEMKAIAVYTSPAEMNSQDITEPPASLADWNKVYDEALLGKPGGEGMAETVTQHGNVYYSQAANFPETNSRYVAVTFYTDFYDNGVLKPFYAIASEIQVSYDDIPPAIEGAADELIDSAPELLIKKVSSTVRDDGRVLLNATMDQVFIFDNTDVTWLCEDVLYTAQQNTSTLSDFDAMVRLQDSGVPYAVDNYIEINGKTVSEIRDKCDEKQYYPIVWYDCVQIHAFGGKSLEIGFKGLQGDTVLEPSQLDMTKPVTLTFKRGFTNIRGYKVKKDITFVYDPERGSWTGGADVSDYDEVKVRGVSGPVLDQTSGNVEFTVTLDKAFYSTDLIYIASPRSYLAALAQQSQDFSYYTEDLLARFENMGLFDTMIRNLLINGKTIEQYQVAQLQEDNKKDPPEANYPLAVMVNTTGNVMKIIVAGGEKYVGKITDIDQDFTIELRRGFLTGNNAMLKEDVSYTYSAATGTWSLTSSGAGDSVTEFNYIAYNGMEIEEGGTISLSEKTLDLSYFYVDFKDNRCTFTVTPTTLKEGLNEVVVTVTAADQTTTDTFTFYVQVAGTEEGGERTGCGCGSVSSMGPAAWMGGLLLAGLLIYGCRKRGRSE